MLINLNNHSPQNRLVYSNTEEINVVSVCEKTRWKYWWASNYVIEVTKYEFWELSKYMNNPPGVEIPLNRESPFSVSFGVSVSKSLSFPRNETKLTLFVNIALQKVLGRKICL